MLILLTMLSTASCGIWPVQNEPTEQAKQAPVCEETRRARQDHAAALVALGDVQDIKAARARVTGAKALAGVATGCGELEG